MVFLTYHFPPEVGGIQTRIAKYLQNLSKRGIAVTVLVAGRNPGSGPGVGGVSVVPVRGGMKRLPRNAVTVATHVFKSRADVVHVFTGSSTLLGVYALLLAKLVGARPVISVFGREDFTFDGPMPRMLLRVAMKFAESIDVNSDATGAFLPAGVRSKVHVLSGAADEPEAPVEAGPRRPVLLFVGRLVQRKGVDDLLRAFASVRPLFPGVRLSVVGDGPERKNLEALAKKLAVADSVEFKGVLVGPELDREYGECLSLVLPSKDIESDRANEGLGLALIEAAMHGKPLIGTRHGGIPEVVKHGENGLLVPPNDPDSLAAALTEVLSRRELAQGMGREALRMARARFSWERATDTLLESYAQ